MKKLVSKALANIAKRKIAEHKPTIIAVTGSVGKTSTCAAIAIALGAKYEVRVPYKNYNNELGLPLAILGEQSPGRNGWEWLKLLLRAQRSSQMPAYLVLEYGADKPGDIAYLCGIAEPSMAVITAVSPVHVENYPSFEALVEEKASLGDYVPTRGVVFLNANDSLVHLMKNRYQSTVVTYGINAGQVSAKDIRLDVHREESFEVGEDFATLRATLSTGKDSVEIALKNCVSETSLAACVVACAVATQNGVPLSDAVHALANEFARVAGRMRPLAGIKGSLLLDDSYNAAPASVMAALETLKHFAPGEEWDRRIVVLGDMAELGAMSEGEHRAVGRKVGEVADMFVAVGAKMRDALDEAEKSGLASEKTMWFATSAEAAKYLDAEIKQGDVVLVKGSQSARMEKVVKGIMAQPQHAQELLVRQEPEWENS